jgi:hypothetical protein
MKAMEQAGKPTRRARRPSDARRALITSGRKAKFVASYLLGTDDHELIEMIS